ncbi:hypothetical protein GCM10008905_17870 [Clostridium malenominatum]|uniref:MgtC/SapB/SrpB/YhiD N-terminal domain-containing protein n=1 Tax=Clostridium malenominatum TaxID=1539 RepID=A0ABP3UA28_9CLOT
MEIRHIVFRLFMAIVIGGAIGYERKFNNRPAGFRTHILVCVGATIVSMIQVTSMNEMIQQMNVNRELVAVFKGDVGRMGAQVISGVGFLGAGTIIHERGSVKGLTTAASLWVVACIGLAVGWGYYYLSLLAALSVVITLVSLKKFENKFIEKFNVFKVRIDCLNENGMEEELEKYFAENNIKIKNIEYLIEEEEIEAHSSSIYTILVPRNVKMVNVLKEISTSECNISTV